MQCKKGVPGPVADLRDNGACYGLGGTPSENPGCPRDLWESGPIAISRTEIPKISGPSATLWKKAVEPYQGSSLQQ